MAMVKFDVDTTNKLFIAKPGVTDVDVKIDLYSDAKEHWLAGGVAMGFDFPLRTVGGDPVTDTKNLGATFFLLHGWRIRPQEANHRLVLTGNLYTDPAGFSPIVSTIGSYSVIVEYSVSNLVDSTVAQLPEIQQAMYQDGVTFNQATGSAGTDYPIGTPQFPVNNLADAKTIGAARGLTRLLITGTATFGVGDTLTGWDLIGTNTLKHHAHTTSGGVLTDCTFAYLHASGPVYGQTKFEGCRIGNVSEFSGLMQSCVLEAGTTTLSTTATAEFIDCSAGTSATIPSIDCGGTGQCVIRGFNGAFTFKNKTGGSLCAVDLNSGFVVVDSTCTGGSLTVRGIGAMTNNSTGTLVGAEGLNQAAFNNLLYAIEALRGSHQAFGVTFYVDPVGGDDTYDGRTDRSAVATITQALTLCTSGRGDAIYVVAPQAATVTLTENVVVNKDDVHIRGASRGTTIQPASGVPVTIDGDNVSLHGFVVKAPVGSTTVDCVHVNGKFSHMCGLFVVGTETGTGCGVVYRGGDYHEMHAPEIEKCGGDGVKFVDAGLASGSPREVTFFGGNVYLNGGHGFHFTGTSGTSTRLNRINGTQVNNNGGYGVLIEANVQRTLLAPLTLIFQNTLGDVSDAGTDTEDRHGSFGPADRDMLDAVKRNTTLIPALL